MIPTIRENEFKLIKSLVKFSGDLNSQGWLHNKPILKAGFYKSQVNNLFKDFQYLIKLKVVSREWQSYYDNRNRKHKRRVYRLNPDHTTFKNLFVIFSERNELPFFINSDYYKTNVRFGEHYLVLFSRAIFQTSSIAEEGIYRHYTQYGFYGSWFLEFLKSPETFEANIKKLYILLSEMYQTKDKQQRWVLNTLLNDLLIEAIQENGVFSKIELCHNKQTLLDSFKLMYQEHQRHIEMNNYLEIDTMRKLKEKFKQNNKKQTEATKK